ncbi:MAG: MFS transporter [Acidimicrobiales bacterium]
MTSATEPRDDPTPAPDGGPLRQANFRRLWFTNVGFFIVVNGQRFVFGALVLDALNRDESGQGLVVFALGIPALFLVLQAGAWADRYDPRRILIATQIAASAVMAGTGLLVASGRATFGLVIGSALLAGAAAAVGQPVRASLVPALVDRSLLFGAIAVNALAMTASMIVGPVLVQIVAEGFGFAAAFFFQAVLLAAGLVFLIPLRIPNRDEPVAPRRSVWVDTLDALRHVWADRHLRTLFGLLVVSSFTINPSVMVTLQAFVKQELGRTANDAAPLYAAMGVGIAITSMVVMRRGDMANKGALFQRAMMAGAVLTFFMGRTTDYWQLFPLTFVMGLTGGFYINMNQGLIQASTPQELMGRVMGLYTMVQAGFLPVGALVLGLIARWVGIGTTMSAASAVAFVVVVVTYVRNAELRQLA